MLFSTRLFCILESNYRFLMVAVNFNSKWHSREQRYVKINLQGHQWESSCCIFKLSLFAWHWVVRGKSPSGSPYEWPALTSPGLVCRPDCPALHLPPALSPWHKVNDHTVCVKCWSQSEGRREKSSCVRQDKTRGGVFRLPCLQLRPHKSTHPKLQQPQQTDRQTAPSQESYID